MSPPHSSPSGSPDEPKQHLPFWSTTTLNRGLLLFWGAWLSLVTTTNVVDALQAAGLVSERWTFASGNYELIVEVIAVHDLPPAFGGFLYVGAILWEGIGATLFWRALLSFDPEDNYLPKVNQAFTVTIALFATFMLMSEAFIAYEIEATHMRIFIALLVSVYLIHRLPAPATQNET